MIFRKVTEKGFLPKVSDYRCHMLTYHLIMWELHAIFAPHEIRLDIMRLLCAHGTVPFNVYIRPAGSINYDVSGLYIFSRPRRECTYDELDYLRPIHTAFFRLRRFFRFSHHDTRRAADENGKMNFYEVWKLAIPEPFANDRALASRLECLSKFLMLTFKVMRTD